MGVEEGSECRHSSSARATEASGTDWPIAMDVCWGSGRRRRVAVDARGHSDATDDQKGGRRGRLWMM